MTKTPPNGKIQLNSWFFLISAIWSQHFCELQGKTKKYLNSTK